MASTGSFRPPPLSTSGTYDDDDYFNSVALNLLSRYEALNLSPTEAICGTLATPKHRASFFEGLCSRLSRASGMSPSVQTLLNSTKEVFGKDLKRIVESEIPNGGYTRNQELNKGVPPTTPRRFGLLRRFFPPEEKLFRSRKVQNLDWKMAEAIQQVQSLRLDSSSTTPRESGGNYQPPRI